MARTPKADQPQLFEAATSIASEWIEQNALSESPDRRLSAGHDRPG
jgi:hypothetical protein